MGVTARRLLNYEQLGLSLVAGEHNADRVITWAHAIELSDPTPYLSGGELVMTTGINVGRTPIAQREYVTRLSDAGISALAVDSGTTLAEIPPAMIAAGNELGMPLLEVPASTPFIAITRAVIDDLTTSQLRSVHRVVGQQELLARETLLSGIPGVVKALAVGLAATVVVMGTDGRLLATHGSHTGQLMELGLQAVERAQAGRRPASRVTAVNGGYTTLQLLKVDRTSRGYLLIWAGEPLSTLDRLLVAHAVSLITIELEKPAKVVDAEQRLRGVVARALVAAPLSTDAGVLGYFDFHPQDQVCIGVFSGVGPQLAAERAANIVLSEAGRYLMYSIRDEVVAIVAAEHRSVVGRVHGELKSRLQRHVRGGISSPGPIETVPMQVEQARTAARASSGELVSFSDLGIFGTILGSRSASELRLIAMPISTLEGADGSDLIVTLEAFLAHNGQVEPAATALGIHRHTLRNRLQRIAQITGSDLYSADVRVQMWISIKARELLAIRAGNTS